MNELEKQVQNIDKNVCVLLEKMKRVENHEQRIRILEENKFVLIGVCIAVSGIFSIVVAGVSSLMS